MTTWDERMTPRRRRQCRASSSWRPCFRVEGASRRPMRCAVYQVETGLELRFEYEDREDLLRSQLFPTEDEDAIAALADRWHVALREKGFDELPIVALL
jgi:hypothetical protein